MGQQVGSFKEFFTSFPGKFFPHSFERSKINDGVDDTHFFIEPSFLRQVTDFVLAIFIQLFAHNFNVTGIRFDDIHHHADSGGLAGAIGAD